MKIQVLVFVIIVFLVKGDIRGYDVQDLIAEGDRLYDERSDLNKAYLALEQYRKVLSIAPGHYDALWKISKTAFYLAEMVPSKGEKEVVVKEGVSSAKKAVEVNPHGVEGYFWLGVSYTKVGEVKGVLKSLFLIGPIKRAMRKVIAMDDTYECGGAYTVLGRVYSQLPGILGGSDKKAREYYEKARSICPYNTLNLLFLAETYWDLGETRLALKTLEDLLEMNPNKQWEAEYIKHSREARKLKKKYETKTKGMVKF